jgi:hypothetical protein
VTRKTVKKTAKKEPPYSFVLEELKESPIAPRLRTKPMFGCTAVYIGLKIVFILRKKDDPPSHDDGIWVAMLPEHNASVLRELASLRPISFFRERAFNGWMNLPEDAGGFEEAALEACRLVIRGDPRIGKIPKPRAKRKRA